ncbi:MAG: carbonic anhydrase [Chlamydiae bacterium CG10_big_fil_rev_8_21_14_0_10_35_9]|nr:MAG: carbonic anhydrase [Chlamydiae bacterium CG10_big_fil_rev_8_21_14_0_10_35_9]
MKKVFLLYLLSAVLVSADNLQRLESGNETFLDTESIQKIREKFIGYQVPFAAFLACADSRVAPEILFSQSIGDLFVVRNAGNVIDDVVIASLEFAVDVLQVPMLIVIGHQNCGAVNGALQLTLEDIKVKPSSLNTIFKKIQPSLDNVVDNSEITQSKMDQAVKDNAVYQLDVLISKSSVIQKKIRKKELVVYALYYEIDTGKVFELNR